jgi:uncharacterized membrane protein YccC
MEGVTTAIVAFLFVCVVFPSLVKNRPQWYAALAAVVLVIFFNALVMAFPSVGFMRFTVFITGMLQIAAIVLLILSAGGLSVRELAGDMKRAYEVIRRGEEEKEVIIPLTGEQPRSREERDRMDREGRIVLEVPQERKAADDQRIPLEDDTPRA